MEPRLNIVTLGVTNLDRARRFCEALGWVASSASQGDIVFFNAGGVVIALYPRDLLAEDANVAAKGSGFRRFTLAQNVRSKKEVAQILNAAKAAGAKIIKQAQVALWGGYSGYFVDPDGNLWEVVWNPFFELTEDGTLQLP